MGATRRGGGRAPSSVAFPSGLRRADAPGWPTRLTDLHDPPLELHYRGDWTLLDRRTVAIVGARAASATGRELARRLARDLASEGVSIVSGLARGIDGAAHLGALDAGGGTVAVLGTGIDRCYPSGSAGLHQRIAREGLLLSELPPGSPPLPHHFPQRNRIIAALAEAVIIVEGGERSGSRITADLALDLGREVMAVPRDPVIAGAVMPNALLKQGATPVTRADDVLVSLGAGMSGCRSVVAGPVVPDRLRWLLSVLEPTPLGVDEIVQACGRSVVDVLPALVDLELRGLVRRDAGGLYRLGEGS